MSNNSREQDGTESYTESPCYPKVICLTGNDGAFELVDYGQNSHQDEFHIGTTNCGRNCLCCLHIYVRQYISSIAMNRRYLPIVPVDSELTCRTFSVIYVMTCRKCGMQYVGQTMCALKDCVLEHRRSMLKGSFNTYLVNHFKSLDHTVQDFTVQIAEVVPDKKDLCECKLFWIKLLNTA